MESSTRIELAKTGPGDEPDGLTNCANEVDNGYNVTSGAAKPSPFLTEMFGDVIRAGLPTKHGRLALQKQADLVEADIADLENELAQLKRTHRFLRHSLCAAVDPTNAERRPETVVRSYTKNDSFGEFFEYVAGLQAIGLRGWFRMDENTPDMLNVCVPTDALAEIAA